VSEAEATIEAPPEPPAAEAEEAGVAAAEPAAKEKPAKAPKEKKAKGKAKKGAVAVEGGGPSVAAHPRASRSVARAKGWGALAGFVLGGYLSLPTHTFADAGLRALIAGAACYLAAWAAALFFWRRMVVLEIKAREQQLIGAAMARRQEAVSAQSAPTSRAGR
jgi:hypothetical protein